MVAIVASVSSSVLIVDGGVLAGVYIVVDGVFTVVDGVMDTLG